MLDCHIHIERGDYTPEWIDNFVDTALERGLDEIYLLEHCYRFREFTPMYGEVCAYSEYINSWFHRKAGVLDLSDYMRFVDTIRKINYPVKIKFGLEVCYFRHYEDLVYNLTKDTGLDFIVGSVHFIDNFAFDHKPEFWEGVDVDKAYRRYFETSIGLAESGIYSGIAHPDCIKLFGHKPSFSLLDYYEKLTKALSRSNMYAEQSSGSSRRTGAELGMNTVMLRIMKKNSVKILTASDAHCPEDVGSYIKELERLVGET
jgi:histidinol-phosphatase (PHP family)